MIPASFARLLLRAVLMAPDTKRRVVEALRYAAKQTDSKVDDAAVDTFEAAWDVVVPVLVGKL
jgi:hypothetical protein